MNVLSRLNNINWRSIGRHTNVLVVKNWHELRSPRVWVEIASDVGGGAAALAVEAIVGEIPIINLIVPSFVGFQTRQAFKWAGHKLVDRFEKKTVIQEAVPTNISTATVPKAIPASTSAKTLKDDLSQERKHLTRRNPKEKRPWLKVKWPNFLEIKGF